MKLILACIVTVIVIGIVMAILYGAGVFKGSDDNDDKTTTVASLTSH